MADSGNPVRWYYRSPKSDSIEGPYDLVEMAGFLAAGDITAETLTRGDDYDAWRPFQERREFQMAKDMPPGVILRHLDEEQKERAKSGFTFYKIYGFWTVAVGTAIYFLKLILFPISHRHDANEWLTTALRILVHYHGR